MSKKFLSPIKLAQGASVPSAGSSGELFYNTTDSKIYTHNGTAWVASGGGVTNSATAPSNPTNGDAWFNTEEGSLFVYYNDGDSGQWVEATNNINNAEPNQIPAGAMMAWGSSVIPNNWLLCDGSAVSRETYASLFAAIGTTYGAGDGTTTFNLPNLKGRTIVGRDSTQTEFDTLGETGGAKTHTLTTSEMPSHKHTTQHVYYQPNFTSLSAPYPVAGDITTSQSGLKNLDSGFTGGGGAHNNLQPYIVLNYIIKASAGITAGDSELATRVGAIEAVDSTQNSRLTALETAVPSVGWTAYTPSFSNITIGNGSTAFYYQKVGKVVHVRGLIIYGSTTSFNGACDFSHPAMAGTYNILHPMGYAEFYGSGLRHGRIVRINDTYSRFVCDVVSGTTVSNAELSNTYPFTWASGYWAMLSMSYETG